MALPARKTQSVSMDTSLPPAEIFETESSHPFPLAADLLLVFQTFISDHKLENAGPVGLFVLGSLLRTVCGVWFGDNAFVITIMFG